MSLTDKNIKVDTTKFANGSILKNTYDGKTSAVTNGKVTFNSGANGTILMEDTGEKVTTVDVNSIKLNRTSYTYNRTTKNGTLTLKATVNPTNATNKKVTYKSSNTKVATVNGNGVVTLKSRGTAVITATSSANSKIKANCKVTVVQRVTSVKLNRKSVTLKAKGKAKQKTCTLKATVNPSNANVKTVTYKSSNSKVATVNSKGKVIAKKKGRATVTVTTRDGRKTAKCTIIVK